MWPANIDGVMFASNSIDDTLCRHVLLEVVQRPCNILGPGVVTTLPTYVLNVSSTLSKQNAHICQSSSQTKTLEYHASTSSRVPCQGVHSIMPKTLARYISGYPFECCDNVANLRSERCKRVARTECSFCPTYLTNKAL